MTKISTETAHHLVFDRELQLPITREYEDPRVLEIAKRLHAACSERLKAERELANLFVEAVLAKEGPYGSQG